MRCFRATLILITPLLLNACGGGGAADGGTTTTPPVETITSLGCNANQLVRLASGANLFNNTWNSAAAGRYDWAQCLQQRSLGTVVDVGWNWRWPETGDQVYAYPSIVVGAKPWDGGPGNDARFPRRIADTPRLQISYEVQTSASGNQNLATSLWFTRTTATPAVPVESDITAEIMIWSDYTPAMVDEAGGPSFRGQITVDGRVYRVYAATDWGDASGGSAQRWTFIVYVAAVPVRSLSVDARRFIDDAIARGLLDPSHAVADVELGNEISSGSGSTWVRGFSVTTN